MKTLTKTRFDTNLSLLAPLAFVTSFPLSLFRNALPFGLLDAKLFVWLLVFLAA